MNDQSNIVHSGPRLGETDYIRTHEEFYRFMLTVAQPAIGNAALRALTAMEQGKLPDPLEQAALETAKVLVPLGSSVCSEFPLTPIKIFEAKYNAIASGMNSAQPAKVLVSGAGDRIPELYGLMDQSADPQLLKERALLLQDPQSMVVKPGPKVIPVIEGLPPKVHIAEPAPEFAAQKLFGMFKEYYPQCELAESKPLNSNVEPELLLSNDTHGSLSQVYKPRSVDLFLLMRFDPNSLIPQGRFSITRNNPRLIQDCYYAIKMLTNLLNLVRFGGHAVVSVGTGNNLEETTARLALLYGLKHLLENFKIDSLEITNPLAKLILPNGANTSEESEILTQINRGASIRTLIVPFSNKLERVVDELRNPGPEGSGSIRFLKALQSGINAGVDQSRLNNS